MLKNKTVVLGVTGSIAAYKMANVASMLVKLHADVNVIMTENATNFINPITFETLTGNKCLVDTFDRNFQFNVEHVALAKRADVFMVAPASANIIGKIAGGIADDMLSTTIMAAKCPKLIAPAMNTNMLENPIVQDNIRKLQSYDYEIIESASGYLACGDTGKGKLPSEQLLVDYILKNIAAEKDMQGIKVLVTAGPTMEAIDPVRFISNHSTGKMGYAIARQAMLRGADVTLVTGKVAIAPPKFVTVVPVTSAQDMYEAVTAASADQDIIIKAAAVADYRPAEVADNKIKKSDADMSIPLTRTKDILAFLGMQREKARKTNGDSRLAGQIICGFSMETQNLLENSRKKLEKKKIDMVAANNLKTAGAGFGTDTNVLTLITQDEDIELPQMSKEECADRLLTQLIKMRK
ncbi:bifunctional phosphopantothenoylcysteine decarboxylase/phosphopantothenate--cysteine ligase CoaBC [Clostridium sp. L2-50]|uniref:bifunctional phosphopantothenoylcysteine decarboxylase/phosphopantothenate--cysteine ligase CoaBC n=1 Tax=Clostridium sp. L2-50 TaxID=411489 RepID=UPI00031CEE8E|nr:bifunctional phosphopantothenoylcysteine decarboxylase/phosphopantothenate--cysteine ligase CoaBC [Clostridium sp. L2-50]UEA75747.1 bifunctional phosphopantothenoylcysteine decarboxylase/phosphopantothenate--cysteine ligase CoaBC [Lachnospiraceae bacterium GAM79]UEA78461.1 bifunctional phosphopantothenoylcysteine decarboxylase/phosphopantothenate--cysteine ligase CoaBC [Lachnospiraceae bacterium GAM79]